MSTNRIVFDVRERVARKEDPFTDIMRAADRLQIGQRIIVIVGFKPRLLCVAMKARGFHYSAVRRANGTWVTTFFKPHSKTATKKV